MATKPLAAETLVALESFIGHDGKTERLIRAGDTVRANDPAVAKWPDKFGSPRFINDPQVEHATAVPGEKR